jgi:ribosomal protein S18 acetylase RimI-like enzyme
VLGRWMLRGSSEVSIERVRLLGEPLDPVGGFIALAGAELSKCRQMDMAALTMSGNRSRREEVAKRLELTRNLFSPAGTNEFYLSKFWIDEKHRGAGHGRTLMKSYISAGHARGLTRFSLDVAAQNEPAIRVYRSFGFKEIRESKVPEAGLHYIAMAAEIAAEA